MPTLRIAVTSTVVLDIHNPPATFDRLVRDLRASNEWATGRHFTTISGVQYTLVALETLDVAPRVNGVPR